MVSGTPVGGLNLFDPRAVRTTWPTIAGMFAVVLAIWSTGAALHAYHDYATVLSCDRAADLCTVTEVHDFWTDERDRFRPSDYLSSKVDDPIDSENRTGGCITLTLSRAKAVSVCEPRATKPEFALGVQRYFTDREQVSLRASLSMKAFGFLAMVFFGGLSLPFLAAGVMGLWERVRPRKPVLPTGREGIGSRR